MAVQFMHPFRHGCAVDGEYFCLRPEFERFIAGRFRKGDRKVARVTTKREGARLSRPCRSFFAIAL